MSEKWNVGIDINKYISNGLKKLDYSLEFAEDRNKLVWDILNELDKEGTLSSYFSSDGFRMKQVKTKNSFLSESEPVSKLLLRFSYYIDFAKFNDHESKENDTEDKLDTLSYYKTMQHSGAIGLSEDLIKIQNQIVDVDFQNQARRKDKNVRLIPKQTITAKDRMEYPELNEYALFLEMINETLGFVKGVSKERQIIIHEKIVRKYGDSYLQMLKRVRKELQRDLPVIKDRIRGTIYFKKLDKGSPEYNFDNDTGYFNEQGDYVEVSENKVELNNSSHLFALMDNYAELKESVWDKPDSDLWIMLYEFEQLVEKSNLESYEKDILIFKIDKMNGEDIIKEINSKYEMEITDDNLSRIYTTYIPNKLAETHKDLYEEWLYTYKIKGDYKTCKKCGEVKLLNSRNFYKEPKGKDGFKSSCIKCQ